MKKSVLITGNAGLLGSRLADWILENHPEYEGVGIDNLFGGYEENIDPRVVFYKRELSTDSIKDIFDFIPYSSIRYTFFRYFSSIK